jgi:SsrA-binding protein
MKHSLSLVLILVLHCAIQSSSFFLPQQSLTTFQRTQNEIKSNTSTSLDAKKQKKKKKPTSSVISTNRSARRNYEVVSTYTAGISLLGSEIKAIRDGKMNLRDGYVRPDKAGRGVSMYNVHIGKHTTAEYFNHEERRVRPLLLTKEECRKLRREIDIKGMTIVPLKAFFNDSNRVKIEIGLCKGKNVRDKRNAIRDREAKKDAARMVKNFRMN